MYDEFDYLSAQILNDIEQRIVDLYNHYSLILIDTYSPKDWVDNEFVYVDDIKHIEDSIEKVGKWFGYPSGWITSREWIIDGKNNISFKDINRWLTNIDLLINMNLSPLVPSENLYPSNGYLYPLTELYPETDLYNTPIVPTNNVRSD